MAGIEIPGSSPSVVVPADRRPVTFAWGLCLVDPDEDVRWVGRAGYHPTDRGTFSLQVRADALAPRELAEARCAHLQGEPDVLDSDLGLRAVEVEWTDGVRWYRTWIVDLGLAVIELDYLTVGESPPRSSDEAIEATARRLIDSIEAT